MARPTSDPSGIPPRRKGAANATLPPARRSPQRARQQQRIQRRRRLVIAASTSVVVIAAIVIVAVTLGRPSPTPSAINWATSSGVKVYGAVGPEGIPVEEGASLGPANTGLTGASIDGVQCNRIEQLAYHHHVHLAIFIDGRPRSLPLAIGMVPPAIVANAPGGQFAEGSDTCLYWIHVHAQDGIIHLESPQPGNFLLGQFFDIWHQALSPTRIGRYSGKVTATVNGKTWRGDASEIPLAEHTQIVLNLGGPTVSPPPVSWKGAQL